MFIAYINIPNIVTYIGLALSIGAIFFSYNKHIEMAVICLIYSGLCDLFDGFLARKIKSTDEEKQFGFHLDSLVDVVCFGITPIVIAVHMGASSEIFFVVFLIFAVCSVTRLAYFNMTKSNNKPLDIEHQDYYYGLPITYSALLFPIIFIFKYIFNPLIFLLILALSFLSLSVMFILKIRVPKPGGIFYIIFPMIAIIVTIVWIYLIINQK